MDNATYERFKSDIDHAADEGRMDQLEQLAGHCTIQAEIQGRDSSFVYASYDNLRERAVMHARKIYETRHALLDKYKKRVDLDYLQAHPGKCSSIYCCNAAGTLWEKMFKFEDGVFQSITCAPGVFVDWMKHESREDAERELIRTIQTIQKVAAEEREIAERCRQKSSSTSG